MATKKFHVGDVLSITTGRVVSLRHIDGVYDILNFMTGDNIFTHQIPHALEECKPHLLEQLPQLKDADASGVTPENWQNWLNEQVARFGEELTVHDIPEGWHEFCNPIKEMVEMVGAEKVIVAIHD